MKWLMAAFVLLQTVADETAVVEAKLRIVVMQSELGQEFLSLEGCPRLSDPTEIGDTIKYKMSRECVAKPESGFYGKLSLNLVTGEVGMNKVVNSRRDQAEIVAQVKRLVMPEAALAARLELIRKARGEKGRLVLRRGGANTLYREVVLVGVAGREERKYQMHVLTGELVESDPTRR